jgi:hypothetical protein
VNCIITKIKKKEQLDIFILTWRDSQQIFKELVWCIDENGEGGHQVEQHQYLHGYLKQIPRKLRAGELSEISAVI